MPIGTPGRVFSWRLGGLRHERELTQSQDPRGADWFALQYQTLLAALAPNRSVAYGIPNLDGYENLKTAAQDTVFAYVGSERTTAPSFVRDARLDADEKRAVFLSRLPILSKLGARYVTSLEPLDSPLLTPIAQEIIPLTGGQIQVHTYRLETALPLHFLASAYTVAAGQEQALTALPVEPLVLEREPELAPGTRLTPAGSSLQIAAMANQRAEFRVQADGAGLLVWLQTPLDGWTATVDGAPVDIIAANVLGMAVPIDADTQRVTFQYTPPGFVLGLRLALLGLLAFAVGTVASVFGPRLTGRSARQRAQSGGKM